MCSYRSTISRSPLEVSIFSQRVEYKEVKHDIQIKIFERDET